MERFKLTPEQLATARKMLGFQNLIFSDNITIFDILLFISSNYIIDYSLKEELLNSLEEIDLNNYNLTEDFFNEILNLIKNKFEKIKKSDGIGEDRFDIFLIKFLIIIKSCYINFNDEEILNFTNRLINSKLGSDKYKLLFRVLCCNKLVCDVNKRNILMEFLFNIDIKTIVFLEDESYSEFFKFLTREDILQYNDILFKKIAKLSVTNFLISTLNKALSKEKLSENKKEILLNYYCKLYDDLNRRHVFGIDSNLKEICNESIFTVAFSDRLLSENDREYETLLDSIIEKRNPNAYSLILSSNLSESKKDIVLRFVGENKERDNYYYIDTDSDKIDLAKVAISSNMEELDDHTFERILCLVNKKASYLKNARESIIKLIVTGNVFNGKQTRLLYVIDKICDNCNSNYIDELVSFCISPNSIVYTDTEYEKIINLILNSSNKDYCYRIVELFTDDGVLTMSDRSTLFLTSVCQLHSDLENIVGLSQFQTGRRLIKFIHREKD